jgi:urease accessory protein
MDAGHLTLVQWLSAGFPVGAYAYSQGLEWAIEAGDLRSAADVRDWICDLVTCGSGHTDAVLFALALDRHANLPALSAYARALAPGAERLSETVELGTALLRTTNGLTGQAHPPMPYPVALGAAAQALGVPKPAAIALFLQSMAANLVQIAVRFVPLGQSDGQAVQTALQPAILDSAARAATAELTDIGTATFRADLASMRHETMDVRIFKT